MLASFCTVVSNVVCKRALKATDATVVTGYSELFGGVVLLAVGLSLGGGFSLHNVWAWGLFAYIVLATCVSYILWYSIVQKYELSKLFIIKLSEPLFAAIIGAIVLQENLWQWHYLLAFVCVGIAVVVSNLNVKKEKKAEGECVDEKV